MRDEWGGVRDEWGGVRDEWRGMTEPVGRFPLPLHIPMLNPFRPYQEPESATVRGDALPCLDKGEQGSAWVALLTSLPHLIPPLVVLRSFASLRENNPLASSRRLPPPASFAVCLFPPSASFRRLPSVLRLPPSSLRVLCPPCSPCLRG
jgi:hypothetical protein